MGGEAGAQSVLGQGSTFWFTARLARAVSEWKDWPKRRPSRHRLQSASYAGRRTHPAGRRQQINQEVAVALLADIGLKVDVANDGLEALVKARSGSYGLILMDVQMPGMDGLEATRPFARCPVVRRCPSWR